MILTKLLSRLLRHNSAGASASGQLDRWLQQGYRCQQDGEDLRAQELFKRALQVDPTSVDAHYLLGALLGKRGELQEAGVHLRQAIAVNPDFADAHVARGNVFLLQNDKPAAAASYERAIGLDPRNAVAHSNLGLIYQGLGNHDAALRHFARTYDLAPYLAGALQNLALESIELGQFERALSHLHERLRERPDDYEALTYLGLVLQNMQRPDEALEFYQSAIKQNRSDPDLLNNLGISLQDLGRLGEAIACYDSAIALRPDFELALLHRSLLYLLLHDFARGWNDYDRRLSSIGQPRRPDVYPRWDGSCLDGRGILVYAEQGIGDEIMFASCLPQVIAASRNCVIECSSRLEQLFRRSFPAATVYATAPEYDFPQLGSDAGIDLQIPMGSLPQYLRRSYADFPQHSGYLQADPERIRTWRQRLAALGPSLKVGISWQGGTHKTRRPLRSLPLASWLPILRTPGVKFFSLQYTDCSQELAQFWATTGIEVVDWQEVRDEYEDAAALVSALDLVISVCTAVIHLGGALGKPVWVLAPFGPEWRYGAAGEKMPWYSSVRIFRQPSYAAWDPVIAAVAHALHELPYAGQRQTR